MCFGNWSLLSGLRCEAHTLRTRPEDLQLPHKCDRFFERAGHSASVARQHRPLSNLLLEGIVIMHAVWGWGYGRGASSSLDSGSMAAPSCKYSGVLSIRTRFLEPCAAQICCSDGILKNTLLTVDHLTAHVRYGAMPL